MHFSRFSNEIKWFLLVSQWPTAENEKQSWKNAYYQNNMEKHVKIGEISKSPRFSLLIFGTTKWKLYCQIGNFNIPRALFYFFDQTILKVAALFQSDPTKMSCRKWRHSSHRLANFRTHPTAAYDYMAALLYITSQHKCSLHARSASLYSRQP